MRRSERPTTPPLFDVVKYAKDSDARIASVRPTAAPASGPPTPAGAPTGVERKSETRLVTRPTMRQVKPVTDSDETWARKRTGTATVVMPIDELTQLPLDHRAGFLLSLMDGTMELETLVEVSPMPRADALRVVRDLFESGVIIFR